MRSRSGGDTSIYTARLNSDLVSTPDFAASSCASIEPQNRRQSTVAHNEREMFCFIEASPVCFGYRESVSSQRKRNLATSEIVAFVPRTFRFYKLFL